MPPGCHRLAARPRQGRLQDAAPRCIGALWHSARTACHRAVNWPARPFVADFHPGRPARNEASIRFATEVQVDSDGDKTHTRTGFDLIPDGDAVMRLIRQIQTGDIDAGTA